VAELQVTFLLWS